MSTSKLILKGTEHRERWEHQERGDYNLERFDREFSDRLYSDEGRQILLAQQQLATSSKAGDS